MQAALVTGKETVELLEFHEPRAKEGMAVVDIAYCGVCGTDVHAYQSGRPYNPAICGHEWTGTVREVGQGVTNLAPGDRVVAGVSPSCGRCPNCLAGTTAYCMSAWQSIVGGPQGLPHGGFAPAIAVTANRLFRVPDALSDIEAALVEPLTVALHAVRRTRIRLGDTAVALGAGPVGLLTAQCLRASGCRVIVVEPDEARAALAARLGADLVFDPRDKDTPARIAAKTGGLGPELVFECAGIAPTIQQAVDIVRRGGSVTLVGLAEGDATIVPGTWLSKEVTFVASIAYLHEEFPLAMRLVAEKRIDVASLHTATYSLSDAPAAFAALATGKTQVKVLVQP